MQLVIPITPVPWNVQHKVAWANDGRPFVRAYSPAAMRQYQKQVRAFVSGFPKTPGPVAVRLLFKLPRPKSVTRAFPCVKPDLGNLEKCFSDACNGILWEDDARTCNLSSWKRYVEGDEWPCVQIEVKPMSDVTAELTGGAT